ncbi:MAG: hypothetical protein JWP59_4759 [Massilia sp.]|jgi:hypothetical protein|nr:hypothetical protein [Massilia sp.]
MLSTAAKNAWGLTVFLTALLTTNACAAAPNDKLAPVATMYRNFAWEALSNDTDLFGNGLAQQPVRMLSQYFDPVLAKMIAEDAACQHRTQAFCKLDFDILFASQDPRIVDLSIAAGRANTVDVKFKDPVTDKETLIIYTVARGTNGWRINDVAYQTDGQRSLRKVFSAPSRREMKEKSK